MYAQFSVLVLLMLVPLGKAAFYCKNVGEDMCLNHAICDHNGECSCRHHFTGYNCKLPTKRISVGAACSVNCENNGTCFDGKLCACPYDFVGDRCDKKRTGLQCKYGELEVVVYRNYAFEGETYLVGMPRANCTLQRAPESDVQGMYKYSLVMDLFNPTLSVCTPTKHHNATTGVTTYTVKLGTSYYGKEYSNNDEFLVQSCDYEPLVEKPGRIGEAKESYVHLTALDPNTNESIKVNVENSLVTLVFTPDHVKDVKGVLVDFLEIYSFNADMTVATREIVKNGCVNELLNATLGPLKNYSSMMNGTYVGKVDLKSFILVEGQPLRFNYRLRFCPGECPVPVCTAPVIPAQAASPANAAPAANVAPVV